MRDTHVKEAHAQLEQRGRVIALSVGDAEDRARGIELDSFEPAEQRVNNGQTHRRRSMMAESIADCARLDELKQTLLERIDN